MKIILRILKLLLVLGTAGVLVFSAYNYGLFGRETWGYQEEERARTSGVPYALIFYADSCAVSDVVMPELEALETGVRMIRVNTDRSRDLDLAIVHRVQVTPTVVIFDKTGQETLRLSGQMDLAALREGLAAVRPVEE